MVNGPVRITDRAVLAIRVEAASARLQAAIAAGHGVAKAASELATLRGLYRVTKPQ